MTKQDNRDGKREIIRNKGFIGKKAEQRWNESTNKDLEKEKINCEKWH